MAFTLKPVIDTWLKLSTAQGATLPDEQRQLIEAGTVLPLSSFELSNADHLQITLGRDTQGQQLQFKGRNTWYVYRPAVQILRDGQVIALPDPPASPAPAPAPAPVFALKPISDTWLKLSTAQGATLPDTQRQFIRGGEALPLESYATAPDDHLKVTLGKNAQGEQVFFKGRNTWYVYRPAVQVLRNGQVILAPSPTPQPTPRPTPQPTPRPTPMPTPTATSYALKTVIDTWLKTSTAQGSALPEDQRQFLNSGTVLPIVSYAPAEDDHFKITLGKNAQGQQIQFKGRNTWYIYRPAVQILRDGRVIVAPPAPAPTPTPTPPGQRNINAKGLRLLKSFEGLRLQAYQDSVGVWTIGYGTTSGVRPGMVITEAQAEALLRRDLDRFERAVSDLVKVPLSDDQFSALVSFTYNVGEGALASSTLLRLLNQRNYQGAADQLLRWDKAGGSTLPGLTRRRKAERALFLGQDYTVFL
ncbi:MAG: lysozyme [Leptolyngbya sp. IPPAS B-1204]